MQCQNCGHQLQPGTRFCTKCGALVAQPSAPTPPPRPAPAQPQISFGDAPRAPLGSAGMAQPRAKSGCGKVLLVLAIIGVLGLAGIGVAVYYGYKFAEEKIKTSEAYTVAIAALKANPEVAERMGTIKETGFPLGNFQENADGTGTAAYRVSVAGTKANGNYTVVMARRQNKWHLLTGKVTLANGDDINVKAAEDMLMGDNADANSNANVSPAPPLPLGKGAQGTVISGGVLNAKAISKPEPAYPPIAKAARASGTVTVQITVDETGKVIGAKAVSGHPLLQQAAIQAAYQARFMPIMVTGRPVKVTGIVTYNFVLQ